MPGQADGVARRPHCEAASLLSVTTLGDSETTLRPRSFSRELQHPLMTRPLWCLPDGGDSPLTQSSGSVSGLWCRLGLWGDIRHDRDSVTVSSARRLLWRSFQYAVTL